ncbi:BofC N-terminal domain-containing protein [Bacillus thermotolerans]|uniref:Bypass-of-forespore C N-terminal domain-containing protein n=1 Tax=Bacillus thermotolerans TaxID=1221996 RepID=A0A0F5IDK0_BACTR|nr:BofC N-terminal domain-containing protein [Bacillus thermotolerans]KKB34546.1 hypothetical protein QY97_02274 [Bacillus thermotolerans]KKB43430.1 hypothetical protein QY95_01675 [Bacillus thermotolerans]
MKRLVFFLLFALLVAAGTRLSMADSINMAEPQEAAGPHKVTVILQERQPDGQVASASHIETIWAMEDFWAAYQDYRLVDMNEETIIFEKKEQH